MPSAGSACGRPDSALCQQLGSVANGRLCQIDSVSGLQDPILDLSSVQGHSSHALGGPVRPRVVRGGPFAVGKRRYRTSSWVGRRRFLFHVLPGPQEDRGPPTHTQPQTHKWADPLSEFQDGDSGIGHVGDSARGLDSIARPQGRVLSCTGACGAPTFPEVCDRRPGVPVQGTALRPLHVSPHLYQGAGSRDSVFAHQGINGVSVSGRHPVCRPVVPGAVCPHAHCYRYSAGGRVCDQRGQEFPSAIAGPGVPGGPFSYGPEPCLPPRGVSAPYHCSGIPFSGRKEVASQTMDVLVGHDGRSRHESQACQTLQEADTVVFPLPLAERSSQCRSVDRGVAPSQPPSPVVARHRESPVRFTAIPSASAGCHHDRCLLSGLGRSSGL